MPGPLSSERPEAGAHTTRQEGTWAEPTKDFLGVYRGKSKTRDEGYGKAIVKVSAGSVSNGSMGQPPKIGQATFKRRRK